MERVRIPGSPIGNSDPNYPSYSALVPAALYWDAAGQYFYADKDTRATTEVYMSPNGTTADDWQAWIAAVAIAAAAGRTLVLRKGTYYVKSEQDLQSALLGQPFRMRTEPGVHFDVTLTSHAPTSETGTPFYHSGGNNLGSVTTVAVTTTTTTNIVQVADARDSGLVIGARIRLGMTDRAHGYEVRALGVSAVTPGGSTPPVITLTGTPVAGLKKVEVECTSIAGGAARGQWTGRYRVDGATWVAFTSAATVAMTGSGLTLNIAAGNAAINNTWSANITLALDAPTGIAWAAGSTVTVIPLVNQARDILLDLTGATMTVHSADKVWELFNAWDSEVRGLKVIDGSGVVVLGGSFDMGSVRCKITDCFTDGKGVSAGAGFALEGARDCEITRSHAVGYVIGHIINACNGWTIKGASARACTIGLAIQTAGAGDSNGSNFGKGDFEASECQDAVQLKDGSHDVTLTLIARNCSRSGVYVTAGSSGVTGKRLMLLGGSCEGGQYGVVADSGGTVECFGTSFLKQTVHSTYAYNGSQILVRGGSAADTGELTAASSQHCAEGANSKVTVCGGHVVSSVQAVHQWRGIEAKTGGEIEIDDVVSDASGVTGGMDGIHISLQDGGGAATTARVRNYRQVGGTYDILDHNNTALVWLGEGCRFAGGNFMPSNSFRNRGTVALNGATGVDVTVPGMVANQGYRISVTRVSTAGTPSGQTPTVVAGSGKFTISGVALDTSTFAWRVIP